MSHGAFHAQKFGDLRRSFKNHNIIYGKSRRTITNLRRELYTECTLDYEEDETDEEGILRETLEARFTKTIAVSSW